jgi:hypothetical protein
MKVGQLLVEGSNAEGDVVWDNVCAVVDAFMRDIEGEPTDWEARVENFGWANRSGTKEFNADTGASLISSVLPDTACNFKIYEYGDDGIAIDNAHHDSPTGGEWYYIVPAKV